VAPSLALAAHHPRVRFGADDRVSGETTRFPACGRLGLAAGRRRQLRVLDVTSTTNTELTRVELDRPLLTAEDVAALLAVPRSSVYEYAAGGSILSPRC
jgi:hypothetical protein